jgi:hypothetical protein
VEAARLAQTYLSRWRDYPRSISLLQTIIESRRKLWQNASESLWRFYYWKMFFISTCNSCGAGWRAFGQAVSQIPADAQAAIGDPRRPMWKPGDFFGRLLGASRGSALGDFSAHHRMGTISDCSGTPAGHGWLRYEVELLDAGASTSTSPLHDPFLLILIYENSFGSLKPLRCFVGSLVRMS